MRACSRLCLKIYEGGSNGENNRRLSGNKRASHSRRTADNFVVVVRARSLSVGRRVLRGENPSFLFRRFPPPNTSGKFQRQNHCWLTFPFGLWSHRRDRPMRPDDYPKFHSPRLVAQLVDTMAVNRFATQFRKLRHEFTGGVCARNCPRLAAPPQLYRENATRVLQDKCRKITAATRRRGDAREACNGRSV